MSNPYVKASVSRPTGNAGRGITPKDRLTVIDVDDILFFPERDEDGVVMKEDIILKPGGYSVSIYITPGTVEMTSNGEGETDAKGFTPSTKGKHPGNKKEIRRFKTNWLGRHCITLLEYCSGEPTDISGSPCNPMEMSVAYTGNKDTNSSEFTFTQVSKGDDIGIYEGTVPAEEPAAVVPTGSTDIAFTTPGQYQLTGGAAAIAKVTGAPHDAVFTLLGAPSGVAPTIETGGAFLLKQGKKFTASPGSQITFRTFADGASSFKYIEQSRYIP